MCVVMYLCCVQVLFSKAAQEKIQQLAENTGTDDERKRAALLLQNTVNVINQVETHKHTINQRNKAALLLRPLTALMCDCVFVSSKDCRGCHF